ncbi:Hypothetical predicted protein [Marmota monax]|uniref:Uncharacterized protein n=1 Tax=Marmota monax TaxID=9995 RepID=A0A5E4BQB1_MARMO|nr:Hypothetical predicted protein [Marmota monax]
MGSSYSDIYGTQSRPRRGSEGRRPRPALACACAGWGGTSSGWMTRGGARRIAALGLALRLLLSLGLGLEAAPNPARTRTSARAPGLRPAPAHSAALFHWLRRLSVVDTPPAHGFGLNKPEWGAFHLGASACL